MGLQKTAHEPTFPNTDFVELYIVVELDTYRFEGLTW